MIIGNGSDKKLILFGAGKKGANFLIMNSGREMNIKFVFDNRKEGLFYGIEIRKPCYMEDVFIIVSPDSYLEIRMELQGYGYREFEDFIPAALYGKKMAVAYGNCHTLVIRNYLMRNKEFNQKYGFYPFPLIQSFEEGTEAERNLKIKEVLIHCDLFIHQSIRKENKFGEKYASDTLLQYVSKKCEVISIPNLYKMPKCFFPQISPMPSGISLLPWEEMNVKCWVKEGYTKEEIRCKMFLGGVYSKEYIWDLWREFKDTLLRREQEWDIKISDYILERYQQEKLFYDLMHITGKLAMEIAIRTLKYMGYEASYTSLIEVLDTNEVFIYEDVRQALGLEYEETHIRQYVRFNVMAEYDMDKEEYVDELYNEYFMLMDQAGSTKENI